MKNYRKKTYKLYITKGEIEDHYTEAKVHDKTTQTSKVFVDKQLTTKSKAREYLLSSNEISKRIIQTTRVVWFAKQEHKVRSKNCYKFEL